jgi:hypothetical protein
MSFFRGACQLSLPIGYTLSVAEGTPFPTPVFFCEQYQ